MDNHNPTQMDQLEYTNKKDEKDNNHVILSSSSFAFDCLVKASEIKEILSFEEKDHVIFPITCFKYEKKDLELTQRMISQLETKGWCIVDLGTESNDPPRDSSSNFSMASVEVDNYIVKKYGKDAVEFNPNEKEWIASFNQEEINSIVSFFEMSEKKKEKYEFQDLYGYSKVDHKQSIHILTQLKKKEDPSFIKSKWYQSFFEKIGRIFVKTKKEEEQEEGPFFNKEFIYQRTLFVHELLYDIIDCISTQTGLQRSTITYKADLPLAFEKNHALLDIVRYDNKVTSGENKPLGETTSDVNCVPHYDPGLFSISLLSTNEGLQLFDPTNSTWYSGPVNTKSNQERLGVLWLGEAAEKVTNGRWKAGVHRVVYPRSENFYPRTTMWYEACTIEQINRNFEMLQSNKILLENVPPKQSELDVESLTKKDIALKIERKFGFMYSKTIQKDMSYCARYSEVYTKEHENKTC